MPTIRDHPVEIILLSENEPVPNNSVVNRRDHSVILNNRFSCVSNQRSYSDPGDQDREGTDTMMLRSGEASSRGSLERASTKGSSRELEQTVSPRNVVWVDNSGICILNEHTSFGIWILDS